jgi:2-polyprenyl-3-methyl-5-hydroxy-6-metoxy-1,4-benzoquinol methylase
VTAPVKGQAAGDLERRLAETVEAVGPYSRRIYLRDGVWTREGFDPGGDFRLRWLLQLVGDLAPKPISELRVLDLGCEEGVFGVEFARHGAEVVAVDGRESNLIHTRFLAEAVGVTDRFQTIRSDVRELNPDELGRFDVVLCLGLLYHLDRSDLLPFARLLRSLSGWGTVIQTKIALRARQRFEAEGRVYTGHSYLEVLGLHGTTAEENEAARKASLTNPESFWLTRPSLVNLLIDAGFTSVVEHVGPYNQTAAEDWVSMLAAPGETAEVHSAPGASEYPPPRWDESRGRIGHKNPIGSRRGWLRYRLRRTRLWGHLRRLRRR